MAALSIGLGAPGALGQERPPIQVRSISMISLGLRGFDKKGRRTPRQPIRVIPYEGTFKLTMQVAYIPKGKKYQWMAWFGNVVEKGFTEIDDAKRYRSRKNPPKTTPVSKIVGFTDRFRGPPVKAVPRAGKTVAPTAGKAGCAYSFHPDPRGHNSGKYPLWLRPVKPGENILYGTVHQRFVYHLMFRLEERHFARYDLDEHAGGVDRMILPYTIALVEADGKRKVLRRVYRGEVIVNALPVEKLRKGAGVTVENIRTWPRQIWPTDVPGIGWGEPAGGLQLGLMPPGRCVRPAPSYRVADETPLQVLVRNLSDEPIEVPARAVAGRFGAILRDKDGKPVPLEEPEEHVPHAEPVELGPGRTRSFDLDLAARFGEDPPPPGIYSIRLDLGELAARTMGLRLGPAAGRLVLRIDARNRIWWEDEQLTPEHVADTAGIFRGSDPDPGALVQADPAAEWKTVQEVVEALAEAGISDISFAVHGGKDED